ncbi:uncharacterized protein TNCV_1940541 [Trichonephila clavipes]|nr:uncharacterized protein TNCV_1940541 [Trichonephila clavipes]
MRKADARKGLEDGLAMRLPLSEPREIYKDKLETDNRSNISSEFNFEIDLPGKRDRSTIYRLNLIKLYRRKPELANLVMENSSEGINSETLYSVKLFMDFGFQGILRESQLYFKLPPDRSSYVRMINAKKKERFLPDPGTIVLRQKDINLITGKPFRIKTCCSSQMLINSLREDTACFLDLGVNGMGQSNRTLPVVWLGRVNRYPYPRIKCVKYRKFEPGDANRDLSFVKKGKFCRKEQRGIVGQQIDFVLKWLSRVGSEVGPTKGNHQMTRIVRDRDESIREWYIRNGGKQAKLFTSALKRIQCNNDQVMSQRKHLDDFLCGRSIGRLECERTQLEVTEELGIAQRVISRL